MTSWLDHCHGLLLEGQSINIVGLSGSGRTRSIQCLAKSLNDGWTTLHWSAAELSSMSREAKRAAVRELQSSDGLPVLLIDDYGEMLVEQDGQWLERLLFSAVHEEPRDDGEYLRCVVCTAPRDREIVGAGSGLRERANVIFPDRADERLEGMAQMFGLTMEGLLRFCGGCSHLVPKRNVSPESNRGVARRLARERAPLWIGELDRGHQERLQVTVSRTSRWRKGDIDEALVPLIVPLAREKADECHMPDVFNPTDYLPLLLPERWPEMNMAVSARRFVARCGNEPRPIWIDNYLSDLERLDFQRLVAFLDVALQLRKEGAGLSILSRNFVDGRVVSPDQVSAALFAAGLSPSTAERLQWRLYDQRTFVNLHARQLFLPKRGRSFGLPIATMILGQAPVGNESDSDLPLTDFSIVHKVWKLAREVPGLG